MGTAILSALKWPQDIGGGAEAPLGACSRMKGITGLHTQRKGGPLPETAAVQLGWPWAAEKGQPP